MSELLKQIKADQLSARKAGRKHEATVLTTLLGEASPSGTQIVTDEHVQGVIKKFLKNLRDVMGYTANTNVQERMQEETAILERYQAAQLTEEELREFISVKLDELNNVEGPKKIGLVMRDLTIKYQGQFDGKFAVELVKEMV
jgi:uncharacterized protein YqeY